MTGLDCNAKSCTHNEECKCCLTSIGVGGDHACKTDDTCCKDFYEDKCGCKNAAETPKNALHVSCDADTCTYWDNQLCVADHIDISGITASTSGETVCATYKNKER